MKSIAKLPSSIIPHCQGCNEEDLRLVLNFGD